MAPKSTKGKGVTSSSQGPKRARMGQEAPMKDASIPKQPTSPYRLLGSWSKKIKKLGQFLRSPFDDDDPIEDEQARVDSDLESNNDDGEDFEMGESTYAPIGDED
ncbi:hypothetical protein HAX54_005541 [Datura stramonium]|uniref:Uncharacterized protein n=1 Tax=Datura stramonium TaxID=4076 RepID=A0ABS8T8Z8_DATST|nr:hypothetical protein [Datura stramonium]